MYFPEISSRGFSHGDFGLVVQTSTTPLGSSFLGAEMVDDEFAMVA
jgi:hypothetical protein